MRGEYGERRKWSKEGVIALEFNHFGSVQLIHDLPRGCLFFCIYIYNCIVIDFVRWWSLRNGIDQRVSLTK